jgi:aldehyde dehydrogenase (NAD+)
MTRTSIIAHRDLEEAIEIANDTPYGLQAYVVSAEDARAHEDATRIDARRAVTTARH